MRTVSIPLTAILIRCSRAWLGREACEDKDYDEISCSKVGCCIYFQTTNLCLSNVGNSICWEEKIWLVTTKVLAVVFAFSMLCCFIYIIRIRKFNTKLKLWREANAHLTISSNCTEILPSSFGLGKGMEISESIPRRDKLIPGREENTSALPTKRQFALGKESDIDIIILENVNKKEDFFSNLAWEQQNCLGNTFKEDLSTKNLFSRSSTSTKVGCSLKDVGSHNLSARGVGLYSSFADEANVFLKWDEITILELIGSGNYGKVYKASYDYMKVAVKVLNVPWEMLPEKQKQEFLHEIRIAIQVSHHENVLRVWGCTLKPVVSIITELCDYGSVLDYIEAGHKLKIDKKLDICIDAARGVLSMHDKNVLHRDIASRNVLVDRNMEARIADFGMCRILEPVRTGQNAAYHTFTKVGPLKWMSPESLLMQRSSKKSDVWSFGVTIWEIFTEKEPYGTEPSYLAAAGVIHKGLHPDLSKLPAPISENLAPLLKGCWRVCPNDRWSMKDILKHLKIIKQNYLSSLSRKPFIATPRSSSSVSSARSDPSSIYTIAVANSLSDKDEEPNLNFNSSQYSSSLSPKVKPYALQTNFLSNVVRPKINPQRSRAWYSGHRSIGPSYEYPKYITLQNRQNAEELGDKFSLPLPLTTSTSFITPTPKFDKQYNNTNPPKRISKTQSCQELSSITPCNAPRETTIFSIPESSTGMRVVYKDIDSISTTEANIPKNQCVCQNTTTLSKLRTEKVFFSDKRMNLLAADIKINEHYKRRNRSRKDAQTKALLEQHIPTIFENSTISQVASSTTSGSNAEIMLIEDSKYLDRVIV